MYNIYDKDYAGIPYSDITWYDVVGQPFGTASYFNAIIFGNANNIVDTKGAVAVGGDFTSQRGLTLGFGNDGKLTGTGYSPDLVRFLVGGNVAMQGPLVVAGHVVVGGNFRAAKGSTYMIGKDGSVGQVQELTDLYQANGGSRYWRLSDRDTHYAVSSYDVPRYIPASRINADTAKFFTDAYESLTNYHDCISGLQPNGTVTEHYHEWILKGNNPAQNVFLLDLRPNGLLNKEIRFETPMGSLAIVILRTGGNAHLQYGLWGNESMADRTLYVFEDARNIYMEVPAAIWGSILAPQAVFYAHQTGGTVNGNAAVGALEVSPTSGFEFHLYPFVGGVECRAIAPVPPVITPPTPLPAPQPVPVPQPIPVPQQAPAQVQVPTPPAPVPQPVPQPLPVPMPQPAPIPQPAPMPQPVPIAQPIPRPMPMPQPAPVPQPVPAPQPIPVPQPVPVPQPIPVPRPIPIPQPIPVPIRQPVPVPQPVPIPVPCPPCPECPLPVEQLPCPPCPAPVTCPSCPEAVTQIEIAPIPIPIPIPCPEQEKCVECLITPGLIFGCVWGCSCCCNHNWEVRLYRNCSERRVLVHSVKMNSCGCFEFKVPYDDFYLLEVCPIGFGKNKETCKPILTLKNVGVASLAID